MGALSSVSPTTRRLNIFSPLPMNGREAVITSNSSVFFIFRETTLSFPFFCVIPTQHGPPDRHSYS